MPVAAHMGKRLMSATRKDDRGNTGTECMHAWPSVFPVESARPTTRAHTDMLVMGCVFAVRFMMPAMTLLGPSS